MNRRQFVLAAGTGAVVASSRPAQESASRELEDISPIELEKLAATAHACLASGEDCLRHCGELLAEGDKSLGQCNKAVLNMLALCTAVSRVASYRTAEAARIRALAAVCGDICRDCSAACKPHVAHHAPCRECFEHCEACAEACDTIVHG